MAEKQNLKKSAIILFALFLGWAVAPAAEQTQKPVAPGDEIPIVIVNPGPKEHGFAIQPTSVIGGEAFSLKVLGYFCPTIFSHLSADVNETENVITFSYLPEKGKGIACLPVYPPKPIGPTFKMKPLKPGSYRVQVKELAPCLVQKPACNLAIIPQYAGLLTVTGETKEDLIPIPGPPGDETSKIIGILSPEVVKALVSNIQVMPDRLAITFTDSGLSTVRAELFRASGALVKSAGLEVSETQTAMFDLPAGIRRGMYLLRLSSGSGEFYSGKVVIGLEILLSD